MKPRSLMVAQAVASALAAPHADAVYLNPDGLGQALLFPYYTVQSAGGSAFNTLISVANRTSDPKVAKINFHEGRNGALVMAFDIYLAPNDMWTAGIVPQTSDPGAPGLLVSNDLGCTNPPLPSRGIDFRNYVYMASNDNAGAGVDRTREGYFEVIEMATLTGASAAAIAPNANGIPANCAAVQGVAPVLNLAPPSGGLSGTVTFINVASGVDFAVNADALAALTTRPMYYTVAQTLDFNVPEIDPVSQVTANGFLYRSTWSRPVDAVTAALMRSSWSSEYVLDAGTRSRTDIAMTFPTKPHYVTTTSASPPFSARFVFQQCYFAGEPVTASVFNREGVGGPVFPVSCVPFCPAVRAVPAICTTSAVATATRPGDNVTALGSRNPAFGGAFFLAASAADQNGSVTFQPTSGVTMTSLATSTRVDLATGDTVIGAHSYRGLPVTGFWVRTYENGALSCNGSTCQGNYGAAFPLVYKRTITP